MKGPTKTGLLILDIDGTLTDSVHIHQSAFLACMQELNLPTLDTNWSNYPNHTDMGILACAVKRAGLPPFVIGTDT